MITRRAVINRHYPELVKYLLAMGSVRRRAEITGDNNSRGDRRYLNTRGCIASVRALNRENQKRENKTPTTECELKSAAVRGGI